jgi:hypothetical protein
VNLSLHRSNGHWVFQYPALQNSGGITSSLIAGIYKLLIPTSHSTLNWHIRILAMSTYLISSFWLIRSVLADRAVQILAYLIICCSGFQLLQPSSDLFAGTLLSLFFLGALRQWPRLLTAFFLAAFGLCKVDMLLAAVLLALFWSWWQWRSDRRASVSSLGCTFGWLLLLLLPGLVLQGANPFAGSRSMVAFLSAYAEFFGYHQFSSAAISNLSDTMETVRLHTFGGAQSVIEIVSRYPALYFDFVGVSAARSLPNIMHVFKLMLVPIAIAYVHHKQTSQHRFLLWGSLIAAVCVILPAWLVIYLRIRYAVKIAAPLIIVAMAANLELSQRHPRYRWLVWLCGIGTIVWELYFFQDMALHSHWK